MQATAAGTARLAGRWPGPGPGSATVLRPSVTGLNRDGWSPLVLAALPGPAAGGCPALGGLQRRSLKAVASSHNFPD